MSWFAKTTRYGTGLEQMAYLPEVIAAFIDAYNRKDVDAMMECLSEKVSFLNISEGKVTAEAPDRESFEALARFGASAFEERHQTVTNAITVSDTTLIEISYAAVVAIDLPNGWKTGQRLAFSGASLFRVANGKIVHIVDQS